MDDISHVVQYRLPSLKPNEARNELFLQKDRFCPKAESYARDVGSNPLFVLQVSDTDVCNVGFKSPETFFSDNDEESRRCSLTTSEILKKISEVKALIEDDILSLSDDVRRAYQQILNGILKGLNQFEQVESNIKLPKIEYHNFVNRAPVHHKELNGIEKRDPVFHLVGLCRGCQEARSLPWLYRCPADHNITRVGGGYRYFSDHITSIKSNKPRTIPKTPFKVAREKFHLPTSRLPKKKVKKLTVAVPYSLHSSRSKESGKNEGEEDATNEKGQTYEDELVRSHSPESKTETKSVELIQEDSDDSGVYQKEKDEEKVENGTVTQTFPETEDNLHDKILSPRPAFTKEENSKEDTTMGKRNDSREHGGNSSQDETQQRLQSPTKGKDSSLSLSSLQRARKLDQINKDIKTMELSDEGEKFRNKVSPVSVINLPRLYSGRMTMVEDQSKKADSAGCKDIESPRGSSIVFDALKGQPRDKDPLTQCSRLSRHSTNSNQSLRHFSPESSLEHVGQGVSSEFIVSQSPINYCTSPDDSVREGTQSPVTEKSRTFSRFSLSSQGSIEVLDDAEEQGIDGIGTDEEDSPVELPTDSYGDHEQQETTENTRKKRRKKPKRRRTLSFHIGPLSRFIPRKRTSKMESDNEGDDQLPELSMVDFAARFCIVSLERLAKYEKSFLNYAKDVRKDGEFTTMMERTRTEEQKKIIDNYDKALYSLDIYQQKLNDLDGKRKKHEEALQSLISSTKLEGSMTSNKQQSIEQEIRTTEKHLKKTEDRIEELHQKQMRVLDQKKQLEDELKGAGVSDDDVQNVTKVSNFLLRKFGKLENKTVNVSNLGEMLGKLNVDVTEKEVLFIQHILQLPRDGALDFKTFCVVAALSERIAALDYSIKNILDQLDLLSLERKLDKCKELFNLLAESSSSKEEDKNMISVDALAVELTAGGITEDQKLSVLGKLNSNETGMIDFLDFTLYVPLFMMIHDQIIAKPLG